MAQLKIAILGASGIGKFHFREFTRARAEVTSILGSSKETAEKTADDLYSEFGLRPRAYFELDKLLETESIDAVSVCTPPNLHYAQVKKCLEGRLHILCEKPFVLNSYADNYDNANELVELSEKKAATLTVNTQWPSILDYIKNEVDFSKLKSFSMHTEPGASGIDMLTDHLPHTNSMVVKLIPDGHANDITFSKNSEKDMHINFKYANKNLECDITYTFVHKADRPRKVMFSFDGLEFRREIGKNYQQKLITDKKEFDIEDPLKISVEKFVGAIEGKNSPLISKQEILENMALQDRIIRECMK